MDLFSQAQHKPNPSAPPAAPPVPEVAPLDELAAILAMLVGADRMPWPDLPTTMAQELRVIGLARIAGPEGAKLASAIMVETERLFAAEEQKAFLPPAIPNDG
jgi:hypothetical protein